MNENAVAENAMRWWLDSVCVAAVWTSGDVSASCAVEGDVEERCFWRALEARRLEVRKRLRVWRARTARVSLCR